MNKSTRVCLHSTQSTAGCRGAALLKHGGPFVSFATLATILAIIGLSSCAGLTSAQKPGRAILTGSASTLHFGSVPVGNNATQTLTFTNTGTAIANITSATISGEGFTAVFGSPLSAISVGESGTIQIQFAPPSAGAVTGTLTIACDTSKSPLTVSLTGAGTQAGLTMSPASLNFGNLTVGQSSTQTVTLTNSGNINLVVSLATLSGTGFTMSGLPLPATLSGGQSLSFSVQFAPKTGGGVAGSIAFTDNASGLPQMLPLSGSGIASNQTLIANPGSFAFGNVEVGATSPQTITLSNSGNANVVISQASVSSVSGLGFAISGLATPKTIPAGQNFSFTAEFTPAVTGIASSMITITCNASNPNVTIPLSGIGTQGGLSASPSSINFGSLAIGASDSIVVTLTNTGTAIAVISSGSVSGTGFSISGLATPITLNTGQGTSFRAKFAPTSAGNASGSISIASDASDSQLTIAMTGIGKQPGQPQLSATPVAASFGDVAIGIINSQTFRLSNGGTASVTITQATVTGAGFSTTGLTVPTTIPPGGNTTFNAVFAPSSAGAVNGFLSLVSNATGSPTTVSLSGTGAVLSSHSAALTWVSSSSSDVLGYFVYRGTVTGGPYTKQNPSPDAGLSFTDSALFSGQSYFYVVTAVDSNFVESGFSNEVSASIP